MRRRIEGSTARTEDALKTTLGAIAGIQRNVSLMLGAKAAEAEKVRNWLVQHLNEGVFQSHSERLGVCLQIHEQQIEVIDGLTKLCNALSRNMRIILHPEQDQDDGHGMGAGFDMEEQGR
ncbi:restriction endonuclease subunit S [Cohnella sp. CFH 77786]|uniref:restriction endonuclease subunit S n=1 Tax=Cohnella sp. CFH 77786 TaxID=2662265 RepID=UPI001C60D1D9|nr:restriction endonuclease subunit S [Cohnella sp. CFH 77786]MBW5447384.1 restriction endonuclease subunit S [Cohnella sp. CFH 77786]